MAMDVAWIDATVRRYLARERVADAAMDPDDLVQIAWLRGLDRLPSIPTDRERAAYLARLARNAGIDAWRRVVRRPAAPLYPSHPSAQDVEGEALAALMAVAAAMRAPPALVLHGLGYGWREAGALTAQPENTAKGEAFRWQRQVAAAGVCME